MKYKILLWVACFISLSGCGYDDGQEYKKKKTGWTDAKPYLDQYCGGCHGVSKFALTADNFAEAREQVSDGLMPPNGGLPDDAKKAILGL